MPSIKDGIIRITMKCSNCYTVVDSYKFELEDDTYIDYNGNGYYDKSGEISIVIECPICNKKAKFHS